ncbi:hypothetical protein SISNIDRAFT_450143 [Sistotremastrum niveocremeum HHB9708]|uniref:F-box domain-containing protein n=2 Tax=Sistotremastraceae TaxID=3402574 RepID=A0A164YY48_9AGAM|nr:hypothetical protein SISNIDRAFT_450143 [Sistotremastrum niveocremeum HHB9708]KZT33883.1 hypothetical protein SISSUDRAFT_1053647 [Sistotremastrum suecicum HHB10207 ss-3]
MDTASTFRPTRLPPELISAILGFCDYGEILVLSLLAKDWREQANRILWRRVHMPWHDIIDPRFIHQIQWTTSIVRDHVRELDLSFPFTPPTPTFLQSVLKYFGHRSTRPNLRALENLTCLTTLRLSAFCTDSPVALHIFNCHFPNLRSLSFTHLDMPHVAILPFLHRHAGIEDMAIESLSREFFPA